MPWRGVRILPDDENAHILEWILERAENVFPSRQIRWLRTQEITHLMDTLFDAREWFLPRRVHGKTHAKLSHPWVYTGGCPSIVTGTLAAFDEEPVSLAAVSYTHLTLPTNREV